MQTIFNVVNLKATYGGWVLYRDGEFFASSFESKQDAKKFAVQFCELNNLRIGWTK